MWWLSTRILPGLPNPSCNCPKLSFFIGIDLGTSGVRAVAIDDKAHVVRWSHTSLPSPLQSEYGIRQNPSLWWDATQHVLQQLLSEVNGQQVRAIAVDGTSGTMLAIDQHGQPLSDAIMYNDGKSQSQAAKIKQFAPATAITNSASSGLARCLRLRDEIEGSIHRFVTQADWISGRLLGNWEHSDEHNTLKTGYDPASRSWPQWIWQTGIEPSQLPQVHAPGTAVGTINSSIAEQFGLATNCQIVTGSTDSNAALIAAGATQPGDAVTSLGSTLVVKVISEVPITAPEYGVYSHKLGNFWLAGGASNTGGAVLRQFFDNERLKKLSSQIDPDKTCDLDYYPLPTVGERFPVNDSNMTPRLSPRPESDVEFLHGMLQAMARIEKQGYELLHKLGTPYPKRVISAGGGANNPQWQQIRQNLLGTPVTKADQQEAAYGAAKLALYGINKDKPYE